MFGDNTKSAERFSSHTFTSAGTYEVCLNLRGSCLTRKVCKQIKVPAEPIENTLGVLKLYPDKAAGSFRIRVEQIKGTSLTIEVTDISGKDVFYTEFTSTMPTFITTVRLGNDASGIYIVRLKINEGESTSKFFKL